MSEKAGSFNRLPIVFLYLCKTDFRWVKRLFAFLYLIIRIAPFFHSQKTSSPPFFLRRIVLPPKKTSDPSFWISHVKSWLELKSTISHEFCTEGFYREHNHPHLSLRVLNLYSNQTYDSSNWYLNSAAWKNLMASLWPVPKPILSSHGYKTLRSYPFTTSGLPGEAGLGDRT